MSLWSGIGSRRVVCLDWDTRHLRLVYAAVSKGGVRILSVAEVPVPPNVEVGQAASFGAFLRATLRSEGLRTDRVVLNVPRQDAVLNPLKLPPTSEGELANMVRFQIAKELPFALDQAVVDFAVLPKEGDAQGGIELLVAAVRNHIIEYYKAVAQEAGLRIEQRWSTWDLRPFTDETGFLVAVLVRG
ncbi:MAG TPA: pilus assembly protein PilM [Phycisphaerae bacterium]|nr:pilus assembly protein PilM [Phycisphaerae bacterium]